MPKVVRIRIAIAAFLLALAWGTGFQVSGVTNIPFAIVCFAIGSCALAYIVWECHRAWRTHHPPYDEIPIKEELISSTIVLVICAGSFWWFFHLTSPTAWPDQSQFARFHIVNTNVGFNSQNPNQLVANIYVQNDAGDADIVAYSETVVATVAADQTIIDQLRKAVAGLVEEGAGLHFKVRAKEIKWFTVPGPVLSFDQIKKYSIGELTFYFISIVLITEQGTIRPIEHCGFVIGNNPRAIIECPS
jgi:hypothetical protein